MSVICDAGEVRAIYRAAGEKGWVLPCFCTENLTTTEAVLTAAEDYRTAHGLDTLPIILAITCRYDHRSQAVNYTHTRRWDTGLKLFTNDIQTLAAPGGPFERLQVMIHLDHIQHDLDKELLEGDLTSYASILFDASNQPLEENIRKTAAFVKARGHDIVVEGACDEIVDASGGAHNALTTPENARRFREQTGVDLVVCNLGTEHRASGKDLQYHGEISRAIREEIGACIVLHGTSSVPNEQVRRLYADGVCKVNIWTALERDASPGLFAELVRHARRAADEKTVRALIAEGLLTEKADDGGAMHIGYFTTLYRQSYVFEHMRSAVREYLDMWYTV